MGHRGQKGRGEIGGVYLPSQLEFTIMIECAQKSGHCQSTCTLSSVNGAMAHEHGFLPVLLMYFLNLCFRFSLSLASLLLSLSTRSLDRNGILTKMIKYSIEKTTLKEQSYEIENFSDDL